MLLLVLDVLELFKVSFDLASCCTSASAADSKLFIASPGSGKKNFHFVFKIKLIYLHFVEQPFEQP